MAESTRRSYIKQDELPRVSVSAALRVPQALADSYAKKATAPFDVAEAMDMSPNGGTFRDLCGAAVGYGLTTGGPNAQEIALTDLGRRAISPLKDGDDAAALAEAVLVPTIQGDFLRRYDTSPMPPDRIAKNVLESMGVPEDATDRALEVIKENAREVGFLREWKGKTYIRLKGAKVARNATDGDDDTEVEEDDDSGDDGLDLTDIVIPPEHALGPSPDGLRNRRVYISHGKNLKIVQHLKDLITYGELEPVVSVETESASKPVPQKVMDEMRSCSAGIIHVSGEETLIDGSGNERKILNQNVLIEIGAAMALYGDRFILLVEEGVTLPSNLQGLYEVRISGGGSEIGHDATMELLKIFARFKAGPSI